MVHYSPEQRAVAQHPPPRCPKCGSHKTEIVGMSQDMKIAYLRCVACGVRSELPSPNEAIAV
jgi:transcription elongation factor Elf1